MRTFRPPQPSKSFIALMARAQDISTKDLFGISLSRWAGAFSVLVGLVVAGSLFWAISKTFEPMGFQILRAAMTAIAVPFLLLWFHNRRELTGPRRSISGLIVLAIIAFFGAGIALVIIQNLIQPPEWDFLVFWLDGQVGALGLNFYEPANYHVVPLPIDASLLFDDAVLEVGFRYPPQSMFLFLPLGLLDIRSAMIFWYAVHIAVLALTVVLLWRNFLSEYGPQGLVLAAALVVVIGGTLATFKHGQTNFVAMLFLLLFWKDRDHTRGGIWIVLAAYVKPMLFLLLIYPILRKNSRSLLTALTTLFVTSVATIAVFGTKTFAAFIADSPVRKLPISEYTDVTNQSLLSTILRITASDVSESSPLVHPLFLTVAIALAGITFWLAFKLRNADTEWSLALLLMLALLVYPISQYHYSALLVVPLLFLWISRDEIPAGAMSIGAIIVAIFVLIPPFGYIFLANLFLWSVLAAASAWQVLAGREKTEKLRPNCDSPHASHESLEEGSFRLLASH